jgi:predicted RNase H-like nuclease
VRWVRILGVRTERVVGGLDGCPGGWVLATVPVDSATTAFAVTVLPSLEPVVGELAVGRMVCAAIDIPIGLADREPRSCDIAARRALGPRRSSVFPAPVRAVLEAGSYSEACALSRRACGKGISKQLYNILDKIRSVDALQTPGLQDQLFEMSPELSFAELTGRPMPANKRTAEGRDDRRHALASAFGGTVRAVLERPPPAGAKRDDVVDALIGAWTARRRAAGLHVRLGGDMDARGLRMEIIA